MDFHVDSVCVPFRAQALVLCEAEVKLFSFILSEPFEHEGAGGFLGH